MVSGFCGVCTQTALDWTAAVKICKTWTRIFQRVASGFVKHGLDLNMDLKTK